MSDTVNTVTVTTEGNTTVAEAPLEGTLVIETPVIGETAPEAAVEAPAEAVSAEVEEPAAEAPKAPKGLKVAAPAQAEKAIEATGLDMDVFAREVIADGELSAASKESLKAKGVPESLVATYVAGEQAKAQAVVSKIAEEVGGMDAFQTMHTWASTGLNEEERDSFNDLITSGNEKTMRFAVKMLKASYELANGSAGERIVGSQVATSKGVKAFGSSDEAIRAMQDKRWKTDSAYRKQVEARLSVSSVFDAVYA